MKKQIAINIGLFLLSAIIYGEIEATHVTFGPPTLFHTFILNYHVPMAFLMLIFAYGLRVWSFIPLWVLLEDMSFWIFSGQSLESSSWVSMGLGGVGGGASYIPWTYLFLFFGWMLVELFLWLNRSRKL